MARPHGWEFPGPAVQEQGMCLKLQLGANLEFKALSPVPPALAGDVHVHFISYLGTTGKINGNKGE